MEDNINPVMKQILKGDKLAIQMVNELLNDVCAFDTDDGEQTVIFVCPECGEVLGE